MAGHVFEVQVFFGGLDPNAVDVELYAEPQNNGSPFRQKMDRVRPRDTSAAYVLYSATVPVNRRASDYTARIIPTKSGVSVPLEANQILWQHWMLRGAVFPTETNASHCTPLLGASHHCSARRLKGKPTEIRSWSCGRNLFISIRKFDSLLAEKERCLGSLPACRVKQVQMTVEGFAAASPVGGRGSVRWHHWKLKTEAPHIHAPLLAFRSEAEAIEQHERFHQSR